MSRMAEAANGARISEVVEFEPGYGLMDVALPSRYFTLFYDFAGKAGDALPVGLATVDTSPAGSPTLGYVTSEPGGAYQLKSDNTSEQQNLGLYGNDNLVIDPTKEPVFEARFKVNFAGSTFSADQRLVIGLAAARNATLDSNTHHAWFRVEGASLDLLCEADDGTTDSNDQDTGVDIVDNTYITVRIDMTDLDEVKFQVRQESGKLAGSFKTVKTLPLSAITSSNKLQLYAEIQRDAGTEVEDFVIDYFYLRCKR